MRLTCTVNGEAREVDGAVGGRVAAVRAARAARSSPAPRTRASRASAGRARVYLDGVLVCSCLVAAGQAEGREVVTVEGLAARGRAAPGPGGVPRGRRGAVRLLHAGPDRRHPRPAGAQRVADDAEIREALAGNLCRCTGYEKILDAVRLAAACMILDGCAVATVAGPVSSRRARRRRGQPDRRGRTGQGARRRRPRIDALRLPRRRRG